MAASLGGFIVGSVLGYASPATFQLRRPDPLETPFANGSLLLAPSPPPAPTTTLMGEPFGLSVPEVAWFSAIFSGGALAGGLLSGRLLRAVGARRAAVVAAGLAGAGWLLIGLGTHLWSLLVGRVLTGVCVGVVCAACHTYIAETTQASVRGLCVNIFQVQFGLGIMFALGLGGALGWHHLALACALAPLIFGALMTAAPESPLFLMGRGMEAEALASLQRLRGKEADVKEEFEQVKKFQQYVTKREFRWSELRSYSVWMPVVVVMLVMVGQQACGINAVLFNLNLIFKSSGINFSPLASSLIVATIRTFFTVLTCLLFEKFGRKVLLLSSTILMALSLGGLGLFFSLLERDPEGTPLRLSWLPTVCVTLYFVAFVSGIGPVPYLLMSELLPPAIKEGASGMATAVNWGASFMVVLAYEPLNEMLPLYGFYWLFAAINIVLTIVFALLVPETRGKSLEQLARLYEKAEAVQVPEVDRATVEEADEEAEMKCEIGVSTICGRNNEAMELDENYEVCMGDPKYSGMRRRSQDLVINIRRTSLKEAFQNLAQLQEKDSYKGSGNSGEDA